MFRGWRRGRMKKGTEKESQVWEENQENVYGVLETKEGNSFKESLVSKHICSSQKG